MGLKENLGKVPKWAWYTSGGVAAGSVVIYSIQNRGKVEEEDGGDGSDGLVDEGGYQMWEPSPVPGIVVPPVVTSGGQEAGAVGFAGLHETYLGAIGGVMNTVTDLFVGSQTQQSQMLTDFQQTQADWLQRDQQNQNDQQRSMFESFMGILENGIAGGAPHSPAPTGAVAAPPAQLPRPAPPPPPAPAPGPPPCPPGLRRSARGCYKIITYQRATPNASGRGVSCKRYHVHRYYNGSGGYNDVVVSVTKVKNGAC